MKQSTARRKGLTILMSRRMKHTYPRAIRLAKEGRIDLLGLVSHRFPLNRAAEAFRLNAAYEDNVVKAVIESMGRQVRRGGSRNGLFGWAAGRGLGVG